MPINRVPPRNHALSILFGFSVLILLAVLAAGGFLSVRLFVAMGGGDKLKQRQEPENRHVDREVLRVQRQIDNSLASTSDFDMQRFVQHIQLGHVITAYAEATEDFRSRMSIQQFTNVLGPDFLNGHSASIDSIKAIPSNDAGIQMFVFTARTLRDQPITFKLALVQQDSNPHLPTWQVDHLDLHMDSVADASDGNSRLE